LSIIFIYSICTGNAGKNKNKRGDEMTRVYENAPAKRNYACMEVSGELAGQPFSGCRECEDMSNMRCHGVKKIEENFAQIAKKALHYV